MRFIRRVSLLCLTSILIASCGAPAETASPGEVQTVVAVTIAAMTRSAPTPTMNAPTEMPPPQPQQTPTEPVFKPYSVQTIVQNVNLRVGPGTLFKVSRVMAQGTTLEVIGRARGGGDGWFYVKNEEEIFGWILAELVAGDYDGPPPEFVEPENAILITGVVKTEFGIPVTGIGFAIEQGSNRTDASTDNEGRFYAYLPANLSGTWMVSYVSVYCTSNTMDSNCNCKSGFCGTANPQAIEVTLPQTGELMFVWK